jgi:hypothetical protein
VRPEPHCISRAPVFWQKTLWLFGHKFFRPQWHIIIRQGQFVWPGTMGTTIVLPSNCRNADLSIYDVSGRIVERIRNITSNAIIFRPKNKSTNCYIAVVKNTGMQYSAKFVTR